MIEPMIQNKNRYNFPNMKTGSRFRSRFHMLPNKCTCMILYNRPNNSHYKPLCKSYHNHEDMSIYILQNKYQ